MLRSAYFSGIVFSLNVPPVFLPATLKPLLPWTLCGWLEVTSSHLLACQSSWTWLLDLCLEKCCANTGSSHHANYAHGQDGLGHTCPCNLCHGLGWAPPVGWIRNPPKKDGLVSNETSPSPPEVAVKRWAETLLQPKCSQTKLSRNQNSIV